MLLNNITFLSFLLFSMCQSIQVAVNTWLNCSLFRYGKEPSLLEFGTVRVLPNIRVRSVRVLSSYGKMKVRFWFGSMWVLIHIYLVFTCLQFTLNTQRESKNPYPEVF